MQRKNARGSVALLVLPLIVILATVGCSRTVSEDELAKAREQGAEQAEQQQQMEELQNEVDRLADRSREAEAEARRARRQAERAERKASRSSGGGSTNNSGGSSGTSVGGTTACGNGVYAGANTSCPFALNVAGEWGSSPRSSLEAYSPTTGRYYTMYCTTRSSGGHVCTGGNNASVYFP